MGSICKKNSVYIEKEENPEEEKSREINVRKNSSSLNDPHRKLSSVSKGSYHGISKPIDFSEFEESKAIEITPVQNTFLRQKLLKNVDTDSSTSDSLPMPQQLSNRLKNPMEYIVGMDLDSGSKGVGVWFMNQVRIMSGKFANMQASGINLSFFKKKEQEEKSLKKPGKSLLFNPMKLLRRVKSVKSLVGIAKEVLHYKIVDVMETEREIVLKVRSKKGDKLFTSIEILGETVRKMKKDAEKFLRKRVKQAVVVVPSDLNHYERLRLYKSFTKVGIKVKRTITGSTSCGLYYGYKKYNDSRNERVIMVYNHGNSCLNVSVLKIQFGIYEVISTYGSTDLGGSIFIIRVMNYLENLIKETHNIDFSDDEDVRMRIRMASEKAVEMLSKTESYEITIPKLIPQEDDEKENIDFTTEITKEKFENLCKDLLLGSNDVVEKVIEDAVHFYRDFSKKEDLDSLVVVGHITKYPKIVSNLSEYFGTGVKITNMDESSITYGAALLGAIIQSHLKLILVENVPFTLGIETNDGKFLGMVKKNNAIPCRSSVIFRTGNKDDSGLSVRMFELDKNNEPIDKIDVVGIFNFSGIPTGDIHDIEITVKVSSSQKIEVFVHLLDKGKKPIKALTSDMSEEVKYSFPNKI